MERVLSDGMWSFFSPDEVPDLHYIYGEEFKDVYEKYEAKGKAGELRIFKQLPAADVWKKHLSMLFESSHPWITFKDAFNVRNTIKNVGPILSTNLCCVAGDQLIPTNVGFLTAEELYREHNKTNLNVAGLNKIERSSPMLKPVEIGDPIKILTKEGYTHSVTKDHKVWVKDKGYVEAQNLVKGDRLVLQQVSLWPDSENDELEQDLSFLIGLVTGDGTFTKHSVCIDIWNDKEMADKCKIKVHNILNNHPFLNQCALNTSSVLNPEFSYRDEANKHRLTSAPLKNIFEYYGFTDDKYTIPKFIINNKHNLQSYLEGLFYADGTLQGSYNVCVMSLCSTKKYFLETIQVLLLNYGIKTSLTKMDDEGWRKLPNGKGGYKKYFCNAKYRLFATSIKACTLLNKITKLNSYRKNKGFADKLTKDGYPQKMHATYVGFETLKNQPAYCISMNNEDHLWTCNGFITKNTEISLPTSSSLQDEERQQVCNLSSINLANHLLITQNGPDGKKKTIIDYDKLETTIRTAVRMLDNVIDVNFYATEETERTNKSDRPVGLGIMGFQDVLYKLDINYDSEEAIKLSDSLQEYISYIAIDESCNLSEWRGKFPSYEGSEWSKGNLPYDTLRALADSRKWPTEIDMEFNIDTDSLKKKIKKYGMRNSYLMAIAPTVTISNIIGVTQSIEPMYKNLFAKSNLSGEFTFMNEYLVEDLKKLNLWNQDIIDELKYNDGSVQNMDSIPDNIKRKYKTAFEIDPLFIIKCAAARQKWIDQAQSLNLYIDSPSGKKLKYIYEQSWKYGLKSTYYLRSQLSTTMEKSTIDTQKFDGGQQAWIKNKAETPVCNLEEGCESCN